MGKSKRLPQTEAIELGIRKITYPRSGKVSYHGRVYWKGVCHNGHFDTLEEARDWRTTMWAKFGKKPKRTDPRPYRMDRTRHDFGIWKAVGATTGTVSWIVRLRIGIGETSATFDNIVDAYLHRAAVFEAYGRPKYPAKGNRAVADAMRAKRQKMAAARIKRLQESFETKQQEWRDAA